MPLNIAKENATLAYAYSGNWWVLGHPAKYGMVMVYVPAVEFQMGGDANEASAHRMPELTKTLGTGSLIEPNQFITVALCDCFRPDPYQSNN